MKPNKAVASLLQNDLFWANVYSLQCRYSFCYISWTNCPICAKFSPIWCKSYLLLKTLARPSRPSFTAICPEPRFTVSILFLQYLWNQLADLRIIFTNMMQKLSFILKPGKVIAFFLHSDLSWAQVCSVSTIFVIALEPIGWFVPNFHQIQTVFVLHIYNSQKTLATKTRWRQTWPTYLFLLHLLNQLTDWLQIFTKLN